MRKKHGFTPKYINVQAPTATMNRHRHSRCHYKRNSGSTPAGTNNPPHWRACGATKPWVARRRPLRQQRQRPSPRTANSSIDDLRADAAATRPSPTTPLEGQGQATKAVEPEVSPREAPTISSAEKPLPAASVGGGTGSSVEAAQAGEPDTRHLPAPRTANTLPPDHTEGRSGPLPARRQAPTRRTPLPSTDDEHP
jgi:hypothetical protein